MRTALEIAWGNLRAGGRRVALLGTALMLVTCLLVLLLSLSAGLSDSLIRAATTISSGHVNVAGFFKPAPGDCAPLVSEAPGVAALAEAKSGATAARSRMRGWGKVISDTGSLWAGFTGVDIDAEPELVERLVLAEEREYKDGGRAEVLGSMDALGQRDTALLFVDQAKRLEVGVGDLLTIRTETMRGLSNTLDVTVGAIARDLGMISNWSVFLPNASLRKIYQLREDTTGAFQLYYDDIAEADAAAERLRAAFAEGGYRVMEPDPQPFWMKMERVVGEDWTGQKIDVTVWSDEVSYLTWAVNAVDSVSFLLIAILAGLIAIGIMNALWIAVRERTREVGTLRAIGMGGGQILLMFLGEALILGLVATTAGALLGAGIAAGIDAANIPIPVDAMRYILMSDTVHLVNVPERVVVAVVALTLMTGLSALGPSLRAARLRPITALGHTE